MHLGVLALAKKSKDTDAELGGQRSTIREKSQRQKEIRAGV